MNRRTFLRRSGILTAGALVTGPAVLEAFERLHWKRRLFAGWSKPSPTHRIWLHGDSGRVDVSDACTVTGDSGVYSARISAEAMRRVGNSRYVSVQVEPLQMNGSDRLIVSILTSLTPPHD